MDFLFFPKFAKINYGPAKDWAIIVNKLNIDFLTKLSYAGFNWVGMMNWVESHAE